MAKKLKKDFDRDKMYSKIMPTSGSDTQGEETAYPPAPPPVALQTDEAGISPRLDAPAPKLHNFMEDMLMEKLPHTMKVLRSCPCERCRLDILAISLNALPSAYAVTADDESADRIKKLRREYEVKVTATLIKAVQQVKTTPRH